MALTDMLKSVRKVRNLTQKDVADTLGISEKAYSKIETGVNGLDNQYIKPLCNVLKIPYGVLLSELMDGVYVSNKFDDITIDNLDEFIISFDSRENMRLSGSLFGVSDDVLVNSMHTYVKCPSNLLELNSDNWGFAHIFNANMYCEFCKELLLTGVYFTEFELALNVAAAVYLYRSCWSYTINDRCMYCIMIHNKKCGSGHHNIPFSLYVDGFSDFGSLFETFVQNPKILFTSEVNGGVYDSYDDKTFSAICHNLEIYATLWNDKPALSLFALSLNAVHMVVNQS